ncbi:hypothetical protein MVEG_00497 [Podila verticillata NRRL 6337]|nr:hypothetical protein MVEG_00497 [Podila verticillata NRRL 6337]
MDPLSPVDLNDTTFVLTRPFDLSSTTTNGFPGGLSTPGLTPYGAFGSASAIPSSLPSLLYNQATHPLLTSSDASSTTFAALCPWSHSTSPTPSLSPSPLHLTPSSSQPLPTLSTESLTSTLSHSFSRSHSPFSTTEDDTHGKLWSSWIPLPSHEHKSSPSFSSLSSSPMSQSPSASSSTSSTSSSSSSSLTCSICHKKYANNSTLRRHQKIHVYAKNESRVSPLPSRLPPYLASTPNTTTTTSSVSTTSFSPLPPLPGSLVLPTTTTGATLERVHTIQGYSPGSDPDIKKPECVGCGKAFARRDTVILHIKNQKRHWDEFVALREQWVQEKKVGTSTISGVALSTRLLPMGPPSSIDASSGTADREDKKNRRGERGSRPRKAADRYRKAEKLWHSTQQGRIHRRRKGVLSLPLGLRTRHGARIKEPEDDDMFEFELEDVDAVSAEDEWEEEEDEVEEGDDDVGMEEEDGRDTEMYCDVEVVANMDATQKFEWIMRAMKMPPCWKERKVRLFGAFGVLEESVLQ